MKHLIGILMLMAAVVSASAFDVTLAWDANSEPDIAGYRIYYGKPGEQPKVIDSPPSANPRQVVSGLELGGTYVFYATALNTAGLESDPSESITFTVPTKPAPPRGLRVVVTIEVTASELQ